MSAIQDAITRLATCGDVSDVKTADLAAAELEAMREVIEAARRVIQNKKFPHRTNAINELAAALAKQEVTK